MKRFYAFITLCACLCALFSCQESGIDEQSNFAPVSFTVGEFPTFDPDSRAVGTPDVGKTAWEAGDELLVVTDAGSFTTLTRSAEGVWVAAGVVAGLMPESQITVTYAPNCALVAGVVTPKSDLPLGTGEYFCGSATYAEGVVTISFAQTERNYSRLRLATSANKSLSVTVTGFTPAGATEQIDANYTLTTDEKGNAYLYGLFAEGATIAVDNSGTITSRTLTNGTVAGKSYALDSKSYCYLPAGETFNTTLKNNLGSCTAVKFVAGSSTTSNTELFTDEFGNKAYAVTNGTTLEIHTSCDKFRANANCYRMFYNLTPLTSIDFNDCFDTSQVTYMYQMFRSCAKLNSIDLSSFDTAMVTNMEQMFYKCESLTSLDISKFNTSNVTNMSYMFSNCNNLTSLDVSSFNTSRVTDMHFMFYDCKALTSLDVSGFNTSRVTDMNNMFSECRNLTSLDVSNFDTSKVMTMNSMFGYCLKLASLDVSNFDTSMVTNMGVMFYDCRNLTSLDVSSFNTSQVTNMSYMFGNCINLTSLDVSGFDTSKVTNMQRMFFGCESLTSLDLSNFDTSKVMNMRYMFYYCEALTSLDVSNFDTSKVTTMDYMFVNCQKLASLDVCSFTFSQSPKVLEMFRDIGSQLSQETVPVYVTQEGKTYLEGQNYTDTKARFMVPYTETTLDGAAAYEVINANGLLAWAEATKSNPDPGLVLGADINLAGKAWTPVGTSKAPYTGSMEGNNHKITGLDIDVTAGGDQLPTGLFGSLYYADIRNFSVYGDIEIKANDKMFVGGVTGDAQCSKLTNIHSYVNIHAAAGVTGAQRVGGIAGSAGLDTSSYDDRVIISRCSFGGSINVPDASQTVGGILGYTTSRVEINNCANYGEISATNASYVGGILGYANVWTLYGPYNCLNVGKITGKEKVSAIVGWLRCYSAGTIHTNCYLEGSAGEAFGGPLRDEEVENIVASNPASATAVDATALASGTVTSVLNNGGSGTWVQGADYPEIDRTIQ